MAMGARNCSAPCRSRTGRSSWGNSAIRLALLAADAVSAVRLFRGVVLDHRALMKQDFPTVRGAPPDCHAARPAAALQQRVGEQIGIAAELSAGEVARLPRILEREMTRDLMPILQHIEDVLTAVAAPGGADFPEPCIGHSLEIRAPHTVLRTMEDRLAAAQLLQDFAEPGIGRQPRFHALSPSGRRRTRVAAIGITDTTMMKIVTSPKLCFTTGTLPKR